jgi:hypothetical protein
MQQMNAIAPGGIASMMRGMPQGQPQKPLSPTAGIGNVADRIKAYGPQMLEQKNAVSEDLLNLMAEQQLKSEKEAKIRDMQLKAAQQGQPLTVAQSIKNDLMQMTKQELAPQQAAPQVAGASQQQEQQKQAMMQKLMQGIARAPGAQQMPGMAAGGIVAFQNRGEVPDPLDAARQRRRAAQENLYKFGSRQRQENPEAFAAAQEELRAAERDLSRIEMQISGGPAGVMRQSLRGPDIQGAYEDTASRSQDILPQVAPQLPTPSLDAAQENPLEAIMHGKTGDPNVDVGPRIPPAQVTSKVPVPRPSAAVPGQAPKPGITQTLDKPVMTPGAEGQGISPAMGPQMPDLEAARRMEEGRAGGVYGLSEEERRIFDEREARLKQPPKEQRWYERLGALAPYLAQQRIDPGRGGIAGGLGRIGVAGAQLGAAEKAEEDKRRSALEALQNQRLQAMRTAREKSYEAGKGYEETTFQRGAKGRELTTGEAAVAATREATAQRARTGSEEIQARAREAAADRENRVKVAEIQAAARSDPQSKEAMAVARVQQAINGSQLLKQLAERARFDPEAAAEYRREEQRLYLMLAPDLMINRAPTGGASSTRSAADKIISGG